MEIEQKNPSYFYTKDLYEAAWLYASKIRLINIEPSSNSRNSWFVFENKKISQESSNRYWNGEAIGDIKLYADAIRSLKDRLFKT
ncbi:MAG: DUF5659 domain-containing protein [Candidatus Ratteibacteria bacterium]|nr:DUF5659 domain-containing protein [Candidatus Ratteibacteria bacterium]